MTFNEVRCMNVVVNVMSFLLKLLYDNNAHFYTLLYKRLYLYEQTILRLGNH